LSTYNSREELKMATNPITTLLNGFGSANFQKLVGLVGGPALAVELSHLPTEVRALLVVSGPLFAAIVHIVDAWRAKGPSAALADLEAQLPQLRQDAAATVDFIENSFPEIKPAVALLTARVTALEAEVAPDLTSIESVVRKVLGQVIGGSATTASGITVAPASGTTA